MLVICPHCKKKHTIDAKKIPPNATKARCTSCGQSFALNIKKTGRRKETNKAGQERPYCCQKNWYFPEQGRSR